MSQFETSESAYTKANEYFVDEMYEKALEQYNIALELFTSKDAKLQSTIFDKRSATLLKLGQYDKAIQDTTQAIQLDNNNANAYLRRGFEKELIFL